MTDLRRQLVRSSEGRGRFVDTISASLGPTRSGPGSRTSIGTQSKHTFGDVMECLGGAGLEFISGVISVGRSKRLILDSQVLLHVPAMAIRLLHRRGRDHVLLGVPADTSLAFAGADTEVRAPIGRPMELLRSPSLQRRQV